MLILIGKEGRLCNRLFLFAHLFSASVQTSHYLLDFTLDEYLPLLSPLTHRNLHVFAKGRSNPFEALVYILFHSAILYSARILPWLSERFPFVHKFVEYIFLSPDQAINLDSPNWKKKLKKVGRYTFSAAGKYVHLILFWNTNRMSVRYSSQILLTSKRFHHSLVSCVKILMF